MENGKMMSGVQVVVNGYTIGAVSRNGHYHIDGVPVGARKLTFSMTGFQTGHLKSML